MNSLQRATGMTRSNPPANLIIDNTCRGRNAAVYFGSRQQTWYAQTLAAE